MMCLNFLHINLHTAYIKHILESSNNMNIKSQQIAGFSLSPASERGLNLLIKEIIGAFFFNETDPFRGFQVKSINKESIFLIETSLNNIKIHGVR